MTLTAPTLSTPLSLSQTVGERERNEAQAASHAVRLYIESPWTSVVAFFGEDWLSIEKSALIYMSEGLFSIEKRSDRNRNTHHTFRGQWDCSQR
jgi:hypothetical protein